MQKNCKKNEKQTVRKGKISKKTKKQQVATLFLQVAKQNLQVAARKIRKKHKSNR